MVLQLYFSTNSVTQNKYCVSKIIDNKLISKNMKHNYSITNCLSFQLKTIIDYI